MWKQTIRACALIPFWVDLLLAVYAGFVFTKTLSKDRRTGQINLFFVCSIALLIALFTILLAVKLDSTSFVPRLLPPHLKSSSPSVQPSRSMGWGWVFCPLYVLGLLLFVVDLQFVKQVLNRGTTADLELPDEPQPKQSFLRTAKPTVVVMYVFKVAFLLVCLLANLKLSGVLGASAGSWTWVFLPFYAAIVASYALMFLPAKREKSAILLIFTIIAAVAVLCGLLFNLYAVGAIKAFACVLILFDLLGALLVFQSIVVVCSRD